MHSTASVIPLTVESPKLAAWNKNNEITSFLIGHHCPKPWPQCTVLLHLNQHAIYHSSPSSHCFCLAERGQGDGRCRHITEPSNSPSIFSLTLNCNLQPSSQSAWSPSLYHPLHRVRFDAVVLQRLQKQTNNSTPTHHSVTAWPSHFIPSALIQCVID